MKTKYIWLLAGLIGFTACQNDDDSLTTPSPAPALTAGTADFSKFVSIGNSLTAGFSDGALYKVAQENSMPSIMAQQFALAGGGSFTQPLMNDNNGGLLVGGNPILDPMTGANLFPPRLVFDGSGPVPITSLNPAAVSTTDLLVNNPTGPFNNMGVPGAKVAHLLAPGYGTLNPYFGRMNSSPTSSIIQDAATQNPTFFSLWIGNNDVLGYALSGGDGSDPITPSAGAPGIGFDQSYGAVVAALASGGTKGVVANIPYVTTIPHFTTVPHNPVPLNEDNADALNLAYAQYNGGLLLAAQNNLIDEDEVAERTIVFSEGEGNAMVLIDEDLTDLSLSIGLPNYRQATADDLFVLPLSSLIPLGYGTQIQLEDKWVLTPEEQEEIKTATDAFNATIQATATSANLAFFDANSLMQQLANGGVPSGSYILTADLVTGGGFSLDGVHPTSRGYALMANEMLKAIDIAYGSNFEASENLVDISNYNTNYSPLLQ